MSTATLDRDPATSSVIEIAPEEAARLLKQGQAVLVDVREADEHARESVDGARLMPLSRFSATQVAAQLPAGKSVIFHCRGGKRSMDAASQFLPAARGANVMSVAGGIEAWKKQGLPVRTNERASRLSIMRQVQLVVGVLALTGSALAWFVNPAFVAIPAFLGAGLTFAGATGTCALATILGKMPWNAQGRGALNQASCGVGCGPDRQA
ncbi:MAG: rhodanese-like domain-containing protein [Planctomycetota bacterium]|nr:rhodanese-like domain-containing protein [Planctomycetota bacterium]